MSAYLSDPFLLPMKVGNVYFSVIIGISFQPHWVRNHSLFMTWGSGRFCEIVKEKYVPHQNWWKFVCHPIILQNKCISPLPSKKNHKPILNHTFIYYLTSMLILNIYFVCTIWSGFRQSYFQSLSWKKHAPLSSSRTITCLPLKLEGKMNTTPINPLAPKW